MNSGKKGLQDKKLKSIHDHKITPMYEQTTHRNLMFKRKGKAFG